MAKMTKQELIVEIANFAGDLHIAATRMTPEAFKEDVLATVERMRKLVHEESKFWIFISGD